MEKELRQSISYMRKGGRDVRSKMSNIPVKPKKRKIEKPDVFKEGDLV